MYSNVAQEQDDHEKFEKAIQYLLKALETYEQLTKGKNLIALHAAMCLDNLALVYQRKRDLENALKYSEKAKALFEILVKADPSYLPKYGNSLITIGAIKSPLMDKTSIKDFNQALSIFESLEKESPGAFLPDI